MPNRYSNPSPQEWRRTICRSRFVLRWQKGERYLARFWNRAPIRSPIPRKALALAESPERLLRSALPARESATSIEPARQVRHRGSGTRTYNVRKFHEAAWIRNIEVGVLLRHKAVPMRERKSHLGKLVSECDPRATPTAKGVCDVADSPLSRAKSPRVRGSE